MMPSNDRLLELMAQRATEGLADTESREFEELAAREPGADLDAFEYAAAAFQLAFLDIEPLPEEVARKIAVTVKSSPREAVRPAAPMRSLRTWSRSGWLAAAAMFVAALLFWPKAPGGPAIDEGRAVHLAWKPAEPAGRYCDVTGEVVWDETAQRGYMVFRGLPVNDPKVEQYQLWIVDGRKDHYRHPVDGGVFDATSTGEIRVPFDAKLPVERAATFVLTAEQPGGVVVSDGPFLVLASR